MKTNILTMSLLAALVAVGCNQPLKTVSAPSASKVSATDAKPLTVTAEAGLPISATVEAGAAVPVSDIFTLAQGMSFASRRDPFSLLKGEISFDRQQSVARLVNESGYREDFIPQPDVEETAAKELVPAPNWRVSGIVISDSVLALIDTGTRVVDVRPGQTVPDTEWVVISIDEESVLLRHKRDVTPKEVRVNLQSQIFGLPGAEGGAPGGGQPGGPNGPGGGAGQDSGAAGGGPAAGAGEPR